MKEIERKIPLQLCRGSRLLHHHSDHKRWFMLSVPTHCHSWGRKQNVMSYKKTFPLLVTLFPFPLSPTTTSSTFRIKNKFLLNKKKMKCNASKLGREQHRTIKRPIKLSSPVEARKCKSTFFFFFSYIPQNE